MKKSLFTFLFSSLMVLMVFSSCANINRDDEKTQNEANVIISLGQTGARFSTPIKYNYANYNWTLEIKYADGTDITGTQLKGAETGENTATNKWVYKLEPAKYEITLTGTDAKTKINLIAKKSITVTENQGPQNIVLVPHPNYDKEKEGKFDVLVLFIPKYENEMLNMYASIKLVDYHDKTVVKEYGDVKIMVQDGYSISFSTDTEEYMVPEGLYRIYIDVIYKNEPEENEPGEIVYTQRIIDDSVDNLLEIVASPEDEGATSTLVTNYSVDLTELSSVVYYVVHNGKESGNGISAAYPANLNDVLAKRYKNSNVRAINIYDVTTVSSGTTEGETATDLTEAVPYIDVNLLQENIKYTFNLKINTDATTEPTETTAPTYDYKYSLKRTSPTNFSLTLESLISEESDFLLRFENSSDKRMTIDFSSSEIDVPPITPDLKGDVSLEIDYYILSSNAIITIPDNIENAQWQKYYTTKPYIVIKGIDSSYENKLPLPTINYNTDKTSYTISYEEKEYKDAESNTLKDVSYYFDAFSADKIPLYSNGNAGEIAYASKSSPLEYRKIIVPGMEELIDLTIDPRNNHLYLLYTTNSESTGGTQYKITKMPFKNSSGYYGYYTNNISDKISSEQTPDLLKIGKNGNMFIRLGNSTSYYYKQCLGYDNNPVYGERTGTGGDTSSFIASTITSDSAGYVYLVEGISTETNTDEIRFRRISMNDYTTIINEIPLLKITNSSGTLVADENYNSLFDLFKTGENENGKIFDFSDYKSLEFTDCYINGSYIYLTVRKAYKNTSRGAVLKINIGYNFGVESVSTSLIDQVMPVLENNNGYNKFIKYEHNNTTFYGPTKIIAIKPDELIIVDEGTKDDSNMLNINRIVKLNLNEMSALTVVSDNLGSFEFSDYCSGSFFY